MPKPPSPTDSLEAYAKLAALLDDPFADRADLLRGAGLDEASWASIQRAWAPRLHQTDEGRRYSRIYKATMRSLAGTAVPPRRMSPGRRAERNDSSDFPLSSPSPSSHGF